MPFRGSVVIAALVLAAIGTSGSAVGADPKPAPVTAVPLVRTAQSGPWSDDKTWEGGKAPGAGARVQIREGHAVTYDLNSSAVVRSIHVAGTLTFARDRNTRLDVGLIKIQPGDDASEDGFDCDAHLPNPDPAKPKPALEIGTAAEPIPAKFTALIRLHHVEGLDKETCPAIICCAGRMDLHGAPLANTWLKLATHVKPGENTVMAQGDLSGWRAGDRVILTGTFHPDGDEKTPVLAKTAQTEERVVASVRGGEGRAAVKLDKALAFEHYAEGEFRGEIANLSRNVVIESADPSGVRGHTMYHRNSAGSISYAEFRHLGKKDVLGKYAIHFHMCRGTMRGSSVIGASIWDSQNRWLTIHGTETFNVLDHNLAAVVLPGKALPKQVLSFDDNMGAGFWWANSHNAFTRNVAAECSEYGFAFECKRAADFDPVQSVLQPDGTRKKQDVRVMPFIRFEDNECHAMPFFGLNLRGLTRPVGKIMQFAQQNKALAKEAMEAVPDNAHPFHITRLKVWDTRWPFHAGTTGVYIDGLNVYRSTYGMWRSVTDRHSYRNLKFSETSNRDIHMPLSIGIPEPELNRGSAQGAYYAGIGGLYDDLPPNTVITHVAPEGNLLIVRGVTADSGAVKRVTVNGRRAYSLRADFAEWETVLELPAPGKSVTLSAVAEDVGGRVETRPHKLEYRSPGAKP